MLQPFESLFKEELGTFTGDKVTIHIDPSVVPKFCKARPLLYLLKEMVEKELQRLENLGIVKPVKSSKWAAPIVPVLKPDCKSIRICGDYKLTANKALRLEQYPLPKVEDLFSTLAGGITFTKLDMSQAYQQLLLDEIQKKSSLLTPIRVCSAINTYHSGYPLLRVYLREPWRPC